MVSALSLCCQNSLSQKKISEMLTSSTASLDETRITRRPPLTMPSSQTLVSSRLEKLPTELKLTVLSHLNFSELTEARSLNTGFRRLIEKNGTLLVKSLINAYIHQLRQYISFNIYYDPSVTFLEALDRWISLRGLRVWVTQNTFNGVVEFCDHWDEVKNGIHRVNNWPPWNYDMEEVVDAVVKLHAQYHTTDSRQFEALFYEDLDAFIRDCPQNGCERFGLTGQDLTKVYYTIKDTPNWYFESDVRQPSYGTQCCCC